MRRALRVGLALTAVGAGFDAAVWPWRPGLEPLDLGETPSAAACGACHEAEHAAWTASRHRAAWTNDLMLAGYAAERLDFCVHCHAPSPEAAAEIAENLAFYRSLDPRTGVRPGSVPRQPEPHAAEGITCATCHLRAGEVLTAAETFAPHPTRATPALRDGAFCLPCHDFGMPNTVDGQTLITSTAMQATGAEWRAWRAAGGAQTCQDCHMPGGDHRVRGASDRAFLRASVEVVAERTAEGVRFRLRSVGVGHSMPTGDLFRNLTLEVAHGDGPFATVHRVGHTFEVDPPTVPEPQKRRTADTTLQPGEVRVVDVPAPEAIHWRLRWHDGSPHDEVRGLVPLDAIVVTLWEGSLPR